MQYFKDLSDRYKQVLTQKHFYRQLILGLVLLCTSLGLNYAANVYSESRSGSVVQDLILNNLPVINVAFLYLDGFNIFICFVFALGAHEPRRLPFMLKTIALFIAVRSFFIVLTHLSVPLPAAYDTIYFPAGTISELLSSGNDLFFSGHTGLPFLLSLLFWKVKTLRYLFLGTSLFFGATVLLAHVHYSIDVFGAFFITYAIYDLALFLFKKDYELFEAKTTSTTEPSLI